MPHQLEPGATMTIRVKAGQRYSESVAVTPGEQYHIGYPAGQRWYDLFIPASPAGYANPLAAFFGMRVKGAKCMCLCATYNNTDTDAFAVANNATITAAMPGTLCFFANDVPGFEWNNLGSITVTISRIT